MQNYIYLHPTLVLGCISHSYNLRVIRNTHLNHIKVSNFVARKQECLQFTQLSNYLYLDTQKTTKALLLLNGVIVIFYHLLFSYSTFIPFPHMTILFFIYPSLNLNIPLDLSWVFCPLIFFPIFYNTVCVLYIHLYLKSLFLSLY